jgi:hypothetical protein
MRIKMQKKHNILQTKIPQFSEQMDCLKIVYLQKN